MNNQVMKLRHLTKRSTTLPAWHVKHGSNGRHVGGWDSQETTDRLTLDLDWDGSPKNLNKARLEKQDLVHLQDENRALRRQVKSLVEQLSSGNKGSSAADHGTLPAIDAAAESRNRKAGTSPLSGEASERPNRDLGRAALPQSRHHHHASGAQTDRSHVPRVTASPPRRGRTDAKDAMEREVFRRAKQMVEKVVHKLEDRISQGQAMQQTLNERVWSLEECLYSKDAELSLKEAELVHLRYVVGLAENKRANADSEGNSPPGEAEISLHAAASDMEDYLVEIEAHMLADEEVGFEGSMMLQHAEKEAARRKQVEESLREFKGEDGEYVKEGCPACRRKVHVRDSAIVCEVLNAEGELAEEFDVNPDGTKRRRRRNKKTKGVLPPFDTIVYDTARWFAEKEARLRVLNERRVVQTITSIMCEKISVDVFDDTACHRRQSMKTWAHEYFLTVHGSRSLSDFHLLELIDGCKMYYAKNDRIRHFSRLCSLPFPGEPLKDRACDFYLEVYKEISSFLEEPAPMSGVAEDPETVRSPGQLIDIHAKEDVTVVFKRLEGWKALRRAFLAICAFEWMPQEYQNAEEFQADELEISQDEMSLDAFMSFALDEYESVDELRRELLRDAFKDADDDKSGRLDFKEFKNLLMKIDPNRGKNEISHLFRQIVKDQEDDSVDLDVFCDVMQEAKLDRLLEEQPAAKHAKHHTLQPLAKRNLPTNFDDFL